MSKYVTRTALALLLLGAGGYGVYWWANLEGGDGTEEVVRIAFWNIRDLSAASRDETERKQICAVLSQFDAIAIAEVNDTEILDALEAILDETGQDWESITSEKVGTTAYTEEHYGVIYREVVFDLTPSRFLYQAL